MGAGRRVSLLLLGYLAFVVYGSLVPLDFRPMPLDTAVGRFVRTPFLHLGVESRADWIANGVLYAPLGALSVLWLRRLSWPAVLAVPTALVLGAALAVGVEFAQLFFPPRTVSLNDLIAEGIGLVLGSFAGLWLFRRGASLQVPLQAGRAWLAAHGLAVYALLYLAYSLFPFDLLISAAELQRKVDSDLWGSWLAGQGRRPLLVALLLLVEAGLTLPIGVWLAKRGGGRPGAALLTGLAFGVAMEVAQFLIASGTSQGASVLARAAGVVGGAMLWRRRERWSVDDLRLRLASHAWWLAAVYVVLLLAVNGWFALGWQGLAVAAERLQQTRWLPFYYHYYTSEAQALVSLAVVALMYAPVGVLTWARGGGWPVAAVVAGSLALLVEAAKLFLEGQKPDPTNVLIGAAAAGGVVVLMRWAQRPLAAASRAPGAVAAAAGGAAAARARRAVSPAWLAVPAALLAWHLWSAPALAWASAVLVLACAAAVWWRPVLALLVVPALLPALDLAPWTGWRAWDEFDLLLAAVLAVGFVRTPAAGRRRSDGPWALLFALLALSFAISTLRSMLGGAVIGMDGFAAYHGPAHALRIGKGLVWAALFVALARRIDAAGLGSWRAFSAGMVAGLAWVVAFVLWERVAFVGLLDFADDYRTTGPFSAMHRGGAFIECYLALVAPFAAAWLIEARRIWGRVLAALLLAGAGYAMFVTYSRNGYAAVTLGLAVWLVLAWRRGGAPVPWWRLAAVPVVMAAAAVPVLLGAHAQERLAQWQRDLAVRQAHWADALAMRDAGALAALVGMGVGSFPATHFWRSGEPTRAATYRLGQQDGTPYMRLGGGALTYLDQIVSLPRDPRAVLTLDLRANEPGVSLAVSVCEKWMLTSRRCAGTQVRSGPAADRWTRVEATLDLSALAGTASTLPRSVKFALHSPAQGVVVDVANVRLVGEVGTEMLANGDFARGLDRWLFSTNVDPPYHVHSLPVAVLFEQGWFGAVAWGLLLAAVLARGIGLAWQGSLQAATAVASVAAFLTSGMLNTLIDEPRFLWLLLVVAWFGLAVLREPMPGAAAMPSGRPARS
jgi:VanZ family protein